MGSSGVRPGPAMSVLAAPSAPASALHVPGRGLPALLRRLLLPSYADWFFVALLVWLFLAGPHGWNSLLADGDIGWHIRTGQYIMQTHSVPHADPFSFSRAGQPWFAWEWLSDIVFALLYGVAGLKGVVLFAGVLIAAFGAVLVRYMVWRGASGLIAALVALVAVGASSIHFLARPHLFTLLFLTCAVWLLDADRRRPGRAVWLLAPLTLLWTNLHGGFVVLFVVLGVFAAGAACERAWWRALRYVPLTAGCASATLVNPYGIGLHRHLLEYLRSDWIRGVVQEFQAPTFRSENQLQFEVLLLAGLLAAGVCLRRRLITDALLVIVFAHLALTSARHIPLFAIVAAPVIAMEATLLWEALVGKSRPRSTIRILGSVAEGMSANFRRWSLFAPLVIVAVASIPGIATWPLDFPAQMFPVTLVRTHAREIEGARVLTTDQWADYLLFRFWPGTKVFVDGRTDFYGPRQGGEYIDLWHGQGRWRELLDQYRFDTVLIPPDWPLCALLRQDLGWRQRVADKQAVLFTRAARDVPAENADAAPGAGEAAVSVDLGERSGAAVLRNRRSRP